MEGPVRQQVEVLPKAVNSSKKASAKKSRVKPVPDFSKLHQKWEKQLENKIAGNRRTPKSKSSSKENQPPEDEAFTTPLPKRPTAEQLTQDFQRFSMYERRNFTPSRDKASVSDISRFSLSARKAVNPQMVRIMSSAIESRGTKSEMKALRVSATTSPMNSPALRVATPVSEGRQMRKARRVPRKGPSPTSPLADIGVRRLTWDIATPCKTPKDVMRQDRKELPDEVRAVGVSSNGGTPKRPRPSLTLEDKENATPPKRTKAVGHGRPSSPLVDLSPNVVDAERRSSRTGSPLAEWVETEEEDETVRPERTPRLNREAIYSQMEEIRRRQERLRARQGLLMARMNDPAATSPLAITPSVSSSIKKAQCKSAKKVTFAGVSPAGSPVHSPAEYPSTRDIKTSPKCSELKGNEPQPTSPGVLRNPVLNRVTGMPSPRVFLPPSSNARQRWYPLVDTTDLYHEALADQEVSLFTGVVGMTLGAESQGKVDRCCEPIGRVFLEGDDQHFCPIHLPSTPELLQDSFHSLLNIC